jgi:DNA-binding HxlR family transcriptional regulator
MRKKSSTNYVNEKQINTMCNMAFTLSLLSGRWKPSILWHLQQQELRYMDLRKKLPDATERVLVKQLRELEQDRLIVRHELTGSRPVKVSYALSETGVSVLPLLQLAEHWGDRYKKVF